MVDITWSKEECDKLVSLKRQIPKLSNKEIRNIMMQTFDKAYSKNACRIKGDRLLRETDSDVNQHFHDDGSITSIIRQKRKSKKLFNKEELLSIHGFDPKEFEIKQIKSNEWTTPIDGSPFYNYQSTIIAQPIKYEFDLKQATDLILQSVEPVTINQKKSGKTNLVIPLADLHFGILKLHQTQTYLDDLATLLSRGYKTVVIEELGDMFHSNAMRSSQTIRGTQLNDVDMEQAILDAKAFFCTVVEMCLSNSEELHIKYAEGNHSDLEYIFLMMIKERYPQINLDLHNKARIAYRLDNVGIMLTHGHYGKKQNYPMEFATQFKDVWSTSSWLEIHSGHMHTMEAQNINGVIHRQLGTIKPTDKYEDDNCFNMNYKSTQVFEYTEDKLKAVYEMG